MARRRITEMKRALSDADSDWAESGTLSQKAVRALRTTRGISVVLVGMRHPGYVEDVLEELRRPFSRNGSQESLAGSEMKHALILNSKGITHGMTVALEIDHIAAEARQAMEPDPSGESAGIFRLREVRTAVNSGW